MDTENSVQKQLDLIKNAIYCKDDSMVIPLLQLISDDKIVGADTETGNTTPGYKAFDPLLPGAMLRLVQLEADNQIIIFDILHLNEASKNAISDFLSSPDRVLIFQNAKFDIKWLKVFLNVQFKKVYCTMLGSQIIAGGVFQYHSLKDQVENEFGYYMDKEEGASNWARPELTKSQLTYAATDLVFLRLLRERQIQKFKKLGLLDTADIEFKALEGIAYTELCGMLLNEKRWMIVANRNHTRSIRMEAKISRFLSPNPGLFSNVPDFKVSSDKQLKDALKAAGYQLPLKFDPKKKFIVEPAYIDRINNEKVEAVYDYGCETETMQVDYIEKLIERDEEGKSIKPLYEDIWQMLVKYSRLKQAYTFYGQNWVDKIHPATGRVHPDIRQIETGTGRLKFKEPNFQQIPTENIFRNCWIPAPKKKIIDADYNGCELRILAHESQDEIMCAAFNEGKDLHTLTASMVFNVPYDSPEVGKKSIYRTRAKNLNFGIVYGIGAARFAKNADISVEEAEFIIKQYFSIYRGLERWLRWAKIQATVNKLSRTASGRIFRHVFDEDDKKKKSLAERNGCNFPIQGTNADIIKVAVYNVRQNMPYAKILNIVHDQIVLEVDDDKAEQAKAELEKNMIVAGERFIKRVPVLVDCEILDKWSK